jgi:glutathione synthase/RimK-type ligase-like ATP-grasp enzyme
MIAYIRRLEKEKTDARFSRFDDVVHVLYKDIQWRNGVPSCGGISLGDMAVFYFRAIGSARDDAQALVSYALNNNIRIADAYLVDGVAIRDKNSMAKILVDNDIPHPRTVFANDIDDVAMLIAREKIGYPCILKFSKGGRRGIGTFFLAEESTISAVLDELRRRYNNEEVGHARMGAWPFVIQEYVHNGGDYRAIVVGGECLGIIKRGVKSTDRLVLNSSDRKARKYKRDRWPRDVGRLAVSASNAMKVDVSGVDIVRRRDTGELCVIEVNEAPAFNVFERRTKIDVAERIVSWLRTLT